MNTRLDRNKPGHTSSEGGSRLPKVVLIGKPNVGKSALFNRLTGGRQKVTNYPGVTIEIKSGTSNNVTYVDFPGLYSLCPIVKDEKIALENLLNVIQNEESKDIITMVIEGSRFQESMYLALQVRKLAIKYRKPMIFVITMFDELEANKDTLDTESLEKELGMPVVGVSSKTGKNIAELKNRIESVFEAGVEESTDKDFYIQNNVHEHAAELHEKYGPKSDVYVKRLTRIDYFVLNKFWGGLIFFFVILVLFQSIYTLANPLIDFVDGIVSEAARSVVSGLDKGILKSLLRDGVFGGIGAFLVFVPQIFIMFFIIALIEESGYLARASYLCHKPLKMFGLSGKSFFPLLSGYACAVPAILATRSIESPRARLLTMMAIPMMTCSARLPVYGLLVAALIPQYNFLGGLIGLQGLVFFLLYISGLFVALIITGIVDRIAFKDKSKDLPFVLELPPYRLPNIISVVKSSYRSTMHFIRKAGVIIFVLSFIIWLLSYFPTGSGHLQESYLGMLGRLIQTPMEWIGLDWKYGIAILASFVAREVFVGTVGVLMGVENTDDELVLGLIEKISQSGITIASGLALLVFYMVALQCTSTLAVLKQEYGNYKLPATLLIVYTLLAYVLALGTYRLALLFI